MLSKVTLDEISEKIGISRMTIYKVINNKGKVKEETRQKVLDALEQYHYVPNYNARDLARGEKYRIAYIGVRHSSAKYFAPLTRAGLERAFHDFGDHGLELIIEESDFDNPQKQLRDIERMCADGITNFIIAPSDEYLLAGKVRAIQEEGGNVILLSRYLSIPNRTYVGTDYYKSGMLAAEMLTKIMPAGGRIAVMMNSNIELDSTIRGRFLGFMDWMRDYPGFEVARTISNINTDAQAGEAFDQLCAQYEDMAGLDAIYDISYKLNIFAENLIRIGRDRDIKLVGFDVYEDNIQYIRSSVIDIVIGQQLVEQSYDAVKMLFQKVCYGLAYEEREYYSKLDVIVSSNVDYSFI